MRARPVASGHRSPSVRPRKRTASRLPTVSAVIRTTVAAPAPMRSESPPARAGVRRVDGSRSPFTRTGPRGLAATYAWPPTATSCTGARRNRASGGVTPLAVTRVRTVRVPPASSIVEHAIGAQPRHSRQAPERPARVRGAEREPGRLVSVIVVPWSSARGVHRTPREHDRRAPRVDGDGELARRAVEPESRAAHGDAHVRPTPPNATVSASGAYSPTTRSA